MREIAGWAILAAVCLVPMSASAQSPGGAFACEFIARDSTRLGNATRSDGDVAANDAGGLVVLGTRTRIGAGAVVTGDAVRAGNQSLVPKLVANTILGDISRANVGTLMIGATLPLRSPFCPVPSASCGGPAVRVKRGKTIGPLAPGAYGNVELQNGARLILGAGAYDFCSLRTGRNAKIEIGGAAATTLRVAGDLRLENGSTLSVEGAAPPPVLTVGGTQAKFGAGAAASAFLSAPRAHFQLGRGGRFTGAVCADRIATGRNAALACSDSAPPPTSSTTSTTTSTSTTTTTTAPPTTTTTSTTTTTTAPPTTTTTSTTTTTTAAPTTTTTSTTTTTTAPPTTTTTSSTTTTTAPPPTTTTSSTTTTTAAPPTTTTSSTTTTTAPPPTTTTSSTTTTTAPPPTTTTSSTTTTTAPPPTTTTSSTTTTTAAPPTTTTSSTTTTTAPPTTTTTSSTTTTTAPPTTTTTSTTTTTTAPAGVVCGGNGLDVTYGLDYPLALVGGLAGIRTTVNYAPPLLIPGTGTELSVRQRVTSLLGAGFTVAPIRDVDTNGDQVDDQLFVQITTTLNSIRPGALYRARFDCPAGTAVTPASVRCALSDATALDGLPLDPSLAATLSCSLSLTVP